MYDSYFYKNSPNSLQSILISFRSRIRAFLREGREFSGIFKDLCGQQWWSRKNLDGYSQSRALAIVQHAAIHVPYYRELFDQIGHDIIHLQDFGSWSYLPTLEKSAIRGSGHLLLADNARSPLFTGSTSGTTGSPLILTQDMHAINRENAFVWRQLLWAGLKKGERRAWIRGDMVVAADCHSPPFWRMNRAENMLMFSSYHLAEKYANAYLDALAKFDPIVIQAYPSSVGFLANYLDSIGKRYNGPSLRGIVTSSETLSEDQRSVIERTFRCRVFDWYGQFERVAAIGTCERGTYHLINDYSYVELLPVGDNMFEIVGTGFNNWVMPLVRYRTGDLVVMGERGEVCACGRQFPIVRRIIGRQEDVVKLPDGRQVGRLDHIFKGASGLLEAQIRQEKIDAVHILIVPGSGFNSGTETKIFNNARNRLGSEICINIEVVDAIPRSKSGKLRGVVCNV